MIWFSNDIVGGDPEKTIAPSLIISLIGAGIGIHDDIIDNTEFKNLRKTIPSLFDTKKSLVVGDLLIITGLTSLNFLLKTYNVDIFNSITRVFRDFYSEMAVGEIWEINANKKLDIDLDIYHDMLWRLGADGEACAKIGAITGNATDKQTKVLSFLGRSMGYINRLNEEIKDVLNTGNNLQTRIKNESIPLALVYAGKKSTPGFTRRYSSHINLHFRRKRHLRNGG